MYLYKSKSAISFTEFKNKINEHNTFENDWGFYIDIENEIHNITNKKNSNDFDKLDKKGGNYILFNNNLCNNYLIICCVSFFMMVIVII